MVDINKIILAIDKFLEDHNQLTTTPVEINPYLEKMNLLKDSSSRPGLPIRKILRENKISHAYQIGVNWQIPHSKNNTSAQKPFIKTKPKREKPFFPTKISGGHKLNPIKDLIIKIIEEKYNQKPTFQFEYKPDWLLSYPTKQLIRKHPVISQLYSKLTENKFRLEDKISELNHNKLNQLQSFDIWIGEPFNFAIEFDEKQHFNQFRKITLDFYTNLKTNFPVNDYKDFNKKIEIKPGKSGFTKLKSKDSLFPELLSGEKQDNRIRQRAFRDFLKDLLPLENGFNPTLRIPYQITNRKISDFAETELMNIKRYIIENELI